jgi:hypothetical protein
MSGPAGTVRSRPFPGRVEPGAFAADGTLAVPVVRRAAARIALIDPRTGMTRLLKPRLAKAGARALAWSSDGDWIYFPARGGRIGAHRVAHGRTVFVSERLRGAVLSLAVAR